MNREITKIAIHYKVLPEIFCDLRSNLDKEMAGFLIGCLLSVRNSLWLYIEDFSPASHYTSTSTGVKIGPESFLDLDKKLINYRRNYICVGWYHSHPFNSDFVKPSSVDKQTIHQSFSEFYHISLIIDPKSYCKDIWKVDNGKIHSVKDLVSLVAFDKDSAKYR